MIDEDSLPALVARARRAALTLKATTHRQGRAQHKTGYKASRQVNRFGVRLLPEVVEHLNPLRRWEAIELEAALAEVFREAGLPWVEGGH